MEQRLFYLGLVSLVLCGTFFPTFVAHAALWDEYHRIVNCGTSDKSYVIVGTGDTTQICYYYGGPNGECSYCDLVRVAQMILSLLGFLGIIVASLLFVYAGTLYLSASASSGNVSKAHRIFLNTVVGLIIILAAWLILDVVMKTLYADKTTGWGPWNEILCTSDRVEPYCVTQREGVSALLSPAAPPSLGTGIQCQASNTSCSVESLMTLGYSETEANVMSCIAMTESSGVASTPPYNQKNVGSNSTACGTFQITQTTWNANKVEGCEDFYSKCMNATCNAEVALNLVSKNGYRDWTCSGCNSKAQDCINRYSM